MPRKTPLIQRWLVKRPRYHLHFTPTSASWLNLVERWFARLTDQLRRGVHRNTRELKAAIHEYMAVSNETICLDKKSNSGGSLLYANFPGH